jgi:hypothetical protein
MKNIAKKIMIYSMAGIMQVGLGATVVAASPLHIDDSQRIVQLDSGDYPDGDRQREHDRRQREENERHEREMRRHDGESERDWHERQRIENERHEHAMNDIESFLLGFVLGSVVN